MEVGKGRGAYIFHPSVSISLSNGESALISVFRLISVFSHGVSVWNGFFFFFPNKLFKYLWLFT